jgi:O-antigen/teichoic acid export membrane protein
MTAGLVVVSVIMISMVEPIIELVASARYLPGHVVALPLMLGLVIQNISHIAGVGITLSKQTRYTMYSYIVGIVASAGSIWLLVQPFGILGAAYGALLGKIAQSISYVAFAYKVYPMRFGMLRPAAMVLLAAGTGLALQLVAIEATGALIAYRVAVVALFMTLVWFAMFNASERQRTVQTVMGYLGRGSSET